LQHFFNIEAEVDREQDEEEELQGFDSE